MDTFVTMTIAFIAFTFSSLLVAIQVASGQLTPRIVATTLLRDSVIRSAVGLFIFTLLFAAGTRARTEATIHNFVVAIAAFFGFSSVVMFHFLIDYAARLLRSLSIVWRVGEKVSESSRRSTVLERTHLVSPATAA